jgi:60S ribosome subunit biogenesis protein NIP7
LEREDQKYCIFFHNERIYYAPEKVMRQAANLPKKEVISIGTCFGKFTKSNKFRLHITALDFLAPYAKV